MDLPAMQKRVWRNKVAHGFNLTDVGMEFCFLYGEVGEAFEAWRKKKDDLGAELADVALYLLGLSEMLNIDLAKEMEAKLAVNEQRVYTKVDGVAVRIEG